ncbi:MAG: sulfurtransferase [Steroidobacteraceae bacterium]
MQAPPRLDPLISSQELASRLGDSNLRLCDTTVYLRAEPSGRLKAQSGRADYTAGHIPGAVFVDLLDDFAAPHATLKFMLPTAGQFAHGIAALGITSDHEVIFYNTGPTWWSTRAWFMFREFGFESVRVLDGGLDLWLRQGLPVTNAESRFVPTAAVPVTRRGFFVEKADVIAALADTGTILLNALSAEQHAGRGGTYARRGHITGSRNLPATTLYDDAGCFQAHDALAARFADAGIHSQLRCINYCGGGISATTLAFAQCLLGWDKVQIYDGSLSEWAGDPDLPMATAD